MSAKIIDGKALATSVRADLANRVEEALVAKGHRPGLAVVLVGEDPASQVYVRNKIRACESTGITEASSIVCRLRPLKRLFWELITTLNTDPAVDGILVQLPLPSHINAERVIDTISPQKDVDGVSRRQRRCAVDRQEGLSALHALRRDEDDRIRGL